MTILKMLHELDALVVKGQFIDAVETYFADEVRAHSNLTNVANGKAEKLSRLHDFMSKVEAVDSIVLHNSTALNDATTISEYTYNFEMKDGKKLSWDEIVRRSWADGKVVEERYYPAESKGHVDTIIGYQDVQTVREITLKREVPVIKEVIEETQVEKEIFIQRQVPLVKEVVLEKEVPVLNHKVVEKDVVYDVETIVEVSKPNYIETEREVITDILVEKMVPVEHEVVVERMEGVVKEVEITKPFVTHKVVEKPVEFEIIVEKEVPVIKEVIVEKEVPVIKEIIMEKEVIVEVVVEKEVMVEREVIIEREVPVIKEVIVEKPVEVIKEIIVEKKEIHEQQQQQGEKTKTNKTQRDIMPQRRTQHVNSTSYKTETMMIMNPCLRDGVNPDLARDTHTDVYTQVNDSSYLHSLRIACLRQNFQEFLVGEEVEPWERHPLRFQVVLQALLNLVKNLVVTLKSFFHPLDGSSNQTVRIVVGTLHNRLPGFIHAQETLAFFRKLTLDVISRENGLRT